MAQAVSRRPLTTEASVQFQASSRCICGVLISTWTASSQSRWNFPCQCHSNGAPCSFNHHIIINSANDSLAV
jgi:hypothetical protein